MSCRKSTFRTSQGFGWGPGSAPEAFREGSVDHWRDPLLDDIGIMHTTNNVSLPVEIRTVETFAGDTGIPHDPPETIPNEARRIFGELADANHLRGLSREEFTTALAEHWGDLTSLHPFVDGNSRAQRLYVDQLARRAGWEIDWRAASAPAIQAARNIAFVDGGKILHDVLEPVIAPAGTVLATAVAASPRDTQLDVTDHWRAMIEHVESTPDTTYTWASQHDRPDHQLADIAKLAASDFPSRPGAAISSTTRPTPTSSRTTERTRNRGQGLEL